ncbi:cytochrome P450 [Xylariomycetidae sp. FL0641]|nr:cytochrome P450 [Xylariomycetidae sp. FL0641]
MFWNLLPFLGGLAATYTFFRVLLHLTQDSREPPAAQTLIPFFGPLLAFAWRRSRYWELNLSLPIYTLRLPWFRVYVVNETALITAVQRHFNTISFSPMLVKMSSSFMAVSQEAYDVISRDPTDSKGFIMGMAQLTHHDLSPGPHLDSLNRKSIRIIKATLDRLSHMSTTLRLKDWIDREIMMATSESIYGPSNPFRDPAVLEYWRSYEAGLLPLLIDIFPAITAKKAAQARESLVSAYRSYYQQKGHCDPAASTFIRQRYEYYTRHGLAISDIARIEVGAAVGFFSNTKPAAFWLIYHIFSDHQVLADCRQELSLVCRVVNGTRMIDIDRVKSSCPTLLSTFKEVFRFHGTGVATRMVTEDEVLEPGHFLLRKGSMLVIPAAVQHNLPTMWGTRVTDFQHKRFLQDRTGKRSQSFSPVAFRGFGGGLTLCPGRHFATTEILAFVSLVVLRFDIQPEAGFWELPKMKPGIGLHEPRGDLDVQITPREKREWVVNISGSDEPVKISAEDYVCEVATRN